MTEVMTTGAKVKGKITVRNRERFDREVDALRDGELVFIVRRAHATRKAQANAYYWGVVVERLTWRIKDMTAEEIHEHVLKPMFLSKKGAAVDGNGEIVAEWVIGGSTSQLNSNEFYEYCERIRQWAAEKLDLNIPDPDVDWRDKAQPGPCADCRLMFDASDLVDVEREWSDGGHAGVDVVKVCRSCDGRTMRRAG